MNKTGEESFKIDYSTNIFIARAIQCIYNLGWKWISSNDTTVIAEIPDRYSEKITIHINDSIVTMLVTSSWINLILGKPKSTGISNFRAALTLIEQEQEALYEAEQTRRLAKRLNDVKKEQDLKISESDALLFLESTTFQIVENGYALNTSLYLYFQQLYNFEPYILSFECVERMKFSELIDHIETLEDAGTTEFKNIAFEKLVTNYSIRQRPSSMQDLTHGFVLNMEHVSFEKLSPHDFSTHLLQLISHGATYTKLPIDDDEAKQVTDTFADTLFENRIDDFIIYYTTTGWSAWFCDRGWDMTYLIFDKGLGEFTLFAKTDGL